ncbi:MAG TPA: hypothetical protein DCM64_09185 [Gammaproteobacteria bacterium]|jgi:diguanylate cyclase (GGDEF)-like protein|nr:GGDEF domain-containing protein [Gammaproteobacteria bacterium]MDP6731638.1 GGDEF domain-containing protein [Gammaproteobacteria bacterium]HAJ76617.1 hypothetical protein [Gammaproteobacteria bacterium]
MAKSSNSRSTAKAQLVIENSGCATTGRDPLTGLYYQDFLTQKLDQILQESHSVPIAATLALLQLENFYEIRHWVGKSEANLLLGDIARLLKKSLPDTVTLCRCHHYEFAALLLNECSINARSITDRVKQALHSAVSSVIPPQLELKCAIGLAVLEPTIPSAEVLFARARHQLSYFHQAHATGLPVTTNPAMTPKLAIQRIRQSLQENSLRLSFQPTLSLVQDDLQHYEVRCGVPGGRDLPAMLLFETAVRNALGEAVDRWVISQTLSTLAQKQAASLRFTVNLTLNSLVSSQFMGWLRETMKPCGKLAEQLVFQISEIDVLIAQHHLNYFCEHLSQLRIGLSIKHFGCTTEPFRYLSLLSAQYAKLDVSLLEKLNENRQKQADLKKMVAKLHQHNIQVVAGEVESMTTMPLLWQAQLNFVQGNRIGKPASSLDFKFLKDFTLALH